MSRNHVICPLAFAVAVSLEFHLSRSIGNRFGEGERTTAAEPHEPAPPAQLAAQEAVFATMEENTELAGAASGFSLVGAEGEILFERADKLAQFPASAQASRSRLAALRLHSLLAGAMWGDGAWGG